MIPRGGIYLWCRLPVGFDQAVIARLCLEKDVVLALGDVSSVSHIAALIFRFNVAQLADERIFAIMQQALDGSRRDSRSSGEPLPTRYTDATTPMRCQGKVPVHDAE
jgi:DNA-binding transcriptional MocR family regulator